MRPSKAHFVTSCQQLLALGAVLAVLTPAATVISLDVVQQVPGDRVGGNGHPVELTAYARELQRTSRVPTAPVDADLTEYAMTDARPPARSLAAPGGRTVSTVLSKPEPVQGYGGVGVTWDPGATADDEDLTFRVRTRTDGSWSGWTDLEYHDEHAPDPDTREGRHARPGTDVLFVGRVDDVQVRADARGIFLPSGMSMAVVSPGQPEATDREAPAIDTDRLASAREAAEPNPRLTTVTPQPQIYSREQWGADESLRDKGSLRYFEVHAGFVHHTVNANDYSRDEVPGILRSIYAYHTQSRGWSDVGYNFLVDRFGRIWEGRYGGVDRPVVGAHTLGYNDYSFAMSAIGNFDVKEPTSAMIQAYGVLFAWKLSLHGVDAASTSQVVGPKTFQAINGHRDAGQTACPGRYLYAKIPQIRELAKSAQQDWSGRELRSDLAATPHPDLVVRRASDKQVFVLPTGGLSGFAKPKVAQDVAAGADTVVASPDLTGDGVGDLLVRRTDGTAAVVPGDGAGGWGAPGRSISAFADKDLVTAVGDLDGDGRHDLVARDPAAGQLSAYLGTGSGGFERQRVPGTWTDWTRLASGGDLDGDGSVDLLARDAQGAWWALPGQGMKGFGTPVALPTASTRWASVGGSGDLTGDGVSDLVVRGTTGPAWILPHQGGLTFGQPLGPIARFAKAGTIAGVAAYAGGAMPDVVSVRGDDVLTYVNLDTVDLLPPIATGIRLRGANALFNVGDWDRDGDGDLLYRTKKGALVLRTGDGAGGFGAATRIATGFQDVRLLAAAGDVTGDGYPDLMGQPTGSSMRIYPGDGTEGLQPSYVAHSGINATTQVPVGRWDGDGAPDSLFRTGGTLSVYAGNGPGGLTGGQKLGYDVSPYDWVVGVSDLQVTGHADVIVREKATGLLYALQATARKGIVSRRLLGEGMGVYDLAG